MTGGQPDRFLKYVRVGYPSLETERSITDLALVDALDDTCQRRIEGPILSLNKTDLSMGLPERHTKHLTYADYAPRGDEQHRELIDGLAYAMAPEPSVAHQVVAFALGRQIADALEGAPCRVLLAPIDVWLAKQAEADDLVDTVVQPDVFETRGETTCLTLPQVRIDWAREIDRATPVH